MNETRYAGVAQLVEQLICNQQVGGSSPSTSSTISTSEYGRFPEWPKGADCKSVVNDFGGSNPPPPTKRQSIERCSVLFYSQNLEWEQWIRKPALGNMLDACCNRRGFSAEKRIHHLPPKKRVQICALFCFARRTKAFLPEEGGTAQAVTEGAARWRVCIRANDREGSTLTIRARSPDTAAHDFP